MTIHLPTNAPEIRARANYSHTFAPVGGYERNMMATSLDFPTSDHAVIFDLDGTLADCTHRLRYIHPPKIEGALKQKKDWHAFFTACADDSLITDVAVMLRLMWELGFVVLLVSGRSDLVRGETVTWLARNLLPYHRLYMRVNGDHRPDDIVKREIYLTQIKPEFPRIFAVFDYRQTVVNMWRSEGLRCYQVASDNF